MRLDDRLEDVPTDIQVQIARDAMYANYIERQQRDVEVLKRDEAVEIPAEFSYFGIDGLSKELQSKLDRARPSNIAQAARVDGVTPAALTLLLAILRQRSKQSKSA